MSVQSVQYVSYVSLKTLYVNKEALDVFSHISHL